MAAAVIGAALAAGTAVAQEPELVFEKQLDLSLNPVRPPAAPDGAPKPGLLPAGQPVSLPALVPATDTLGGRNGRIIMGTPAMPGAWRSALNIRSLSIGANGEELGSVCGATLIDERWVMTAAHCVFRGGTGGVRSLRWVVAFADDNRFQQGKALRVTSVHVNREYVEGWLLNDVALLQLEDAVQLPRQKLAAGAGQSAFLAAGTLATVVGWGRTKGDVPGSFSPVLLQANLPVAGKEACDAFRQAGQWGKPDRPLTEADFCAGYGGGDHPMICNGDSGGPLFVSSGTGEAIQAGIVSWVRGPCLNAYGGFTNVGHFEAWIRTHVPNAVFVMPAPAMVSAPLPDIAGATPGGPPAPFGQCAVDVYADGAAANQARLGAELTVRVTTGVAGHLAVFSRTSQDKVVQLYPNRMGAAAVAAGPAGSLPAPQPASLEVSAGEAIAVPGPADGFALKVAPPRGRYAIIAIVMPEGSRLATFAQRFADMAPIERFSAVLAELAEEARTMSPASPRAVCTRQFDVVD